MGNRPTYFKEFHFRCLSVDQHHVGRAAVRDQLHDALGVGVSTERHVLQEEKENVHNTAKQHCAYYTLKVLLRQDVAIVALKS